MESAVYITCVEGPVDSSEKMKMKGMSDRKIGDEEEEVREVGFDFFVCKGLGSCSDKDGAPSSKESRVQCRKQKIGSRAKNTLDQNGSCGFRRWVPGILRSKESEWSAEGCRPVWEVEECQVLLG